MATPTKKQIQDLLNSENELNDLTIAKLLSLLEKDSDPELQFEVVRVLRKLATQKLHQDFILRDSESFLSLFLSLHNHVTENEELELKRRRYLWQFFYNLSVGQSQFQIQTWNHLQFRGLFFNLLTKGVEEPLKNVLFGILYLRLQNMDESFDLTTVTADGVQIQELISLMLSAVMSELDFPLLCLQKLLSSESHSSEILAQYDNLDSSLQNLLLDVIAELGPDVAVTVSSDVSRIFQARSRNILVTSKTETSEFTPEQAQNLRKILSTLCLIATLEGSQHLVTLQQDKSLLIDSVYLLRMIHEIGKDENPNVWTPARKLSDMNQDKADQDPVFGFKRDLIRLIGNLCHKNKENQDYVRDLNGVTLILDCSAADGKNPFITQWVVLAIRNLCMNNPENQNIIRAMDSKGQVDKALLSDLGIDLQL